MAENRDDIYDRLEIIESIVSNVLDDVDQEIGDRENIEFVVNEPYYFSGISHPPRGLEEGQIYIDKILERLPNEFRTGNLSVSEVGEVFSRLSRPFAQRFYDNRNISEYASSNGEIACDILNAVQDQYFDELARNEIKELDLADAFVFAKKKAKELEGDLEFHTYFTAFQRLSDELAEKIELEKERLALRQALKTNEAEPKSDALPQKVVKARRRDIRSERIGLFFYYLFQATGSTGTREDKAKVVSHLTQFSESTIKVMLSNPLANEDKDGFDGDFKAVMTMFKLMGFSGAYELMRRDKKTE